MKWVVIRAGVYCPHLWAQLVVIYPNSEYSWDISENCETTMIFVNVFHFSYFANIFPSLSFMNVFSIIEIKIFLICIVYVYMTNVSQLALRRWPNVNPYVGPTSAHQRWANVDLSIGPTLAQRLHANVGPTLCQRWYTNVGPTLAQRYANVCMPTLYQHWPNGGCVTGFLWGEPIGHRSVTGWTNSRVE